MKKELDFIQGSATIIPSTQELFMGFLSLSLSAFGGALPVAHRILVVRRQWLTSEDFFEVLALCQLLPGPNVLNMAVIIGSRYHKVRGAFFAVSGLMALPMLIVIGFAHLYTVFKNESLLRDILGGVNPAATGLMLAMVLQMMSSFFKIEWPFFRKESVYPLVFMLLSFVGVGVFHLSLLWVLLVLAPLNVARIWWKYKNENK